MSEELQVPKWSWWDRVAVLEVMGRVPRSAVLKHILGWVVRTQDTFPHEKIVIWGCWMSS